MDKLNKSVTSLDKSTRLKKSVIANIIKLVIAVGLLTFVVLRINFSEVISKAKTANVYLIVTAFVLVFLNLFLQYTKWHLTTKTILKVDNKKKTFYSLFYGISGGAFTPARIGDYFGRAIVFKEKPVLEVAVATFVDKFFLLMMVIFWGSISSILFLQLYYEVNVYLTVSLFIVLFVSFYLLTVLLINPATWNNILFNKLRSHNRLEKWLKNLRVLKNLERNYTAKMFVFSFLNHSCYIIQFAILAIAFSGSYEILKYIWAANIVMFIKTIIPSVSLGELGIREGVSVFIFNRIGSTAVIGFNASIFLYLINLLFPSFIGLLLLTKKNDI